MSGVSSSVNPRYRCELRGVRAYYVGFGNTCARPRIGVGLSDESLAGSRVVVSVIRTMAIPGAQKPVVKSVEGVWYSANSYSRPNEKGNQPSRTQTMIDGSPTAPRWLQRQRSNLLARRASSVQSSHQAHALV